MRALNLVRRRGTPAVFVAALRRGAQGLLLAGSQHGAQALLVACLLAAGPGLHAQQAPPEGDAARGKALFAAYRCYACHGYTGETGPGPRLNPPRLDRAAFIAYVRDPATRYRNGGNVAGVMPPYAADDVSDEDLADVYAYLESLPSYSPPAGSLGLEGP
jgi:mono/diheme cytochrome c family protein